MTEREQLAYVTVCPNSHIDGNGQGENKGVIVTKPYPKFACNVTFNAYPSCFSLTPSRRSAKLCISNITELGRTLAGKHGESL